MDVKAPQSQSTLAPERPVSIDQTDGCGLLLDSFLGRAVGQAVLGVGHHAVVRAGLAEGGGSRTGHGDGGPDGRGH